MDFIAQLGSGPFMPHGHCYLWRPEILWLHVISDLVIVIAYYCIPFLLAYVVFRARLYHRYNSLFLLFSIFILACGTTHLMEIINVWQTKYILAGLIKAITAAASLVTALLMLPLIPDIIKALQKVDADNAD